LRINLAETYKTYRFGDKMAENTPLPEVPNEDKSRQMIDRKIGEILPLLDGLTGYQIEKVLTEVKQLIGFFPIAIHD